MKTYVTFGQIHTHSVNGKTLDKDCVAVLTTPNAAAGRAKAFELFGDKFCFEHPEQYWDHSKMERHFPRGYIEID